MRTDELDFDLPGELIAQVPAQRRADSRLLCYRRGDRSAEHRRFVELPGLLRAGDLLVFNDAWVIPARFALVKETGGLVEGLFLREIGGGRWGVLLRDLGRARGLRFAEDAQTAVRVVESRGGGEYEIELSPPQPASAYLERIGRMPLPPYIKRGRRHDELDEMDRQRYQTVYARESGSVAAPTAGLHFTPEILAALDERGVRQTAVTLHVGMGTFKPVTSATLEEHTMHEESYVMGPDAAAAVNSARREGRRIVAVGTTAARVLESQAGDGDLVAAAGTTAIFIYPPYAWKRVDVLLTNFHLPRSTLIALVAAMIGIDEQRRLYQMAIENRYRFFSYGDAMLIE